MSSPALRTVTFDSSVEHGATFRFPVTWSYLTATPDQPRSNPNQNTTPARTPQVVNPPTVAAPAPAPIPAKAKVEPSPIPTPAAEPVAAPIEIVDAPVASAVALIPTQKQAPPGAPRIETKWEMVIPKMARPLGARAPRALPQRARQPAQAPAPAAEEPTEVSFYAGSEASFLPQRWKVLGITAAIVVVGCVIAWVRPGTRSASSGESTESAAGSWSRRTAYVVGAAKGPREILVYSGSQDVKNYRIEFAWVPDPRGVGWIFRATDSANYYGAKLRLMQAGATPTLSVEHFAVIKGVEGAHSRKVITIGRTKNQVLVRMDANGPAFTLFLQGSPADYWTDERFEAGSLGFYEERGERPMLEALRFTLFKKSGLQTVVTSLQ
ncbi:MAG: hypothetical protein JWO19_247 [Bryobacterales bacterium]|nr:hypothetical protein [Bryobacterales bacterium]